MKAAEEIMGDVLNRFYSIEREKVLMCMKLYAEEVIIECAERAKCEIESYDGYTEAIVDKQSILSLINELK